MLSHLKKQLTKVNGCRSNIFICFYERQNPDFSIYHLSDVIYRFLNNIWLIYKYSDYGERKVYPSLVHYFIIHQDFVRGLSSHIRKSIFEMYEFKVKYESFKYPKDNVIYFHYDFLNFNFHHHSPFTKKKKIMR